MMHRTPSRRRQRQWLGVQMTAALVLAAASLLCVLLMPACRRNVAGYFIAARSAETTAGLGVHTPVVLHGRQTKHGPLTYLTLLAAAQARRQRMSAPYRNSMPRFEYDSQWLLARRMGIPPPHPTIPYCQLLYNDHFGIIYNKIPKTGGTSLLRYFTTCSGSGREVSDGGSSSSGGGGNGGTSSGARAALGQGGAAAPHDPERCLRYLDTSNATEVQHVLQSYSSYFVFTFTRNVLARAVSSYVYIAHSMRAGGMPYSSSDQRRIPCSVPWGEFCNDAYR